MYVIGLPCPAYMPILMPRSAVITAVTHGSLSLSSTGQRCGSVSGEDASAGFVGVVGAVGAGAGSFAGWSSHGIRGLAWVVPAGVGAGADARAAGPAIGGVAGPRVAAPTRTGVGFSALTVDSVAPQAASEIAKQLGADFRAVDWTQYERNFFLALKSQKHIMFVILVLIIAVAAFNIAANMIMIVTEKTRDIAILRTVGTTRTQIVGLFLAQGLMLGTVGALLGLGLGAWGAAESQTAMKFLEGLFGIDLLNSDVYFLDYLPADLRGADLVAVVGASLFLSLLATVYPALRAAAIAPARAVHFE